MKISLTIGKIEEYYIYKELRTKLTIKISKQYE